jgi:hypothetical protein
MMEQMLEKHGGDEEAATIAVLAKKEKQLDGLMFTGSPLLANILRRKTKGPMDAFVVKK